MRRFNRLVFTLASCLFVASLAATTNAQTQLPADLTEKIDKVVTDTLSRTGVPSASIAIVKDGQVAYLKAYGDARIEPKTAATPAMRYSIGSISKQLYFAASIFLEAKEYYSHA